MAVDSLLTNPNPAVPRSRSLLSRFSNPISKHARNMFELAIEPADPFKVYSPGELVKGYIVVTVLKGFDITHLVVALHGYAKVYKHQVPVGEGLPVTEMLVNGKGSRGFEYHGNGLASLFQEEQILCGQGFLKKSAYKFAFELQFPAKSLPSTIDFERGTVSYMISATLTRPTTIAPTTTRYKRIKFQDSVEIESLNSPKSRVISLEPVPRRGKVKHVRPAAPVGMHDTISRSQLSRNNTESTSGSSALNPIGSPPLSPAPSEDTIATRTTTSTQDNQAVDRGTPPRKLSEPASEARSSEASSSVGMITATAVLPRHGALPGDMVPVRVTVSHTKPQVRGVVIATLFRQGRIDMHPPIPLASKNKDKRAEYEDVYPRSRTGLGGLYFANAAPNSVFRMDLSQSSTMMIIDPTTLTSDITTSVKVPDTAFPTIANIPGGMISFTYHIEVVIDLFGRLGETRLLPRLTSREPTFTHTNDTGNQMTSEWSHSILDTTSLRRTKSVVCFEMSLVVGTKDSSRKRKQNRSLEPQDDHRHYNGDQEWTEDMYSPAGYDEHYYYDEAGCPHYYDPYEGWDQEYEGYHPDYGMASTNIIPPPEVDEMVDEKTRLKREEQLLMPSQPPQEGESSSSAAALQPSAPVITNGVHHDARVDGMTLPSTPEPAASVVSAQSGDTIRPHSTSPPPALPASDVQPADDKQELERQRLLAQASAPPAEESQATSSGTTASFVASAPVISGEEYNAQTLDQDQAMDDDTVELPQYVR